MDIAIVTDSTCDIPDALVRQYQISVVPNILVIDGKSLEDGTGITRQEFYDRLPTMKTMPTTGTVSSAVYEKLYRRLLDQGARYVLSIHVSSLLSGIFSAASIAAQTIGEKVRVIDSESLSLGLGFQVLAAAESAAQGMSLESAMQQVQEVRRRVRLFAMLDTLDYVRRSGRVSWARARLGNLLSIKPFLEVRQGHVQSRGEARTRRKGIERLGELLRGLGPLERLAMLHTNAEQDVRQFLIDVEPVVDQEPLVVHVTTIIGAHVGPNAMGFVAVVK